MKNYLRIFLATTLAFSLVACTDAEKEAAVETFNENVATIESNNEELQSALDSLNDLIDSGDQPLNEETLTNAEQVAEEANAYIFEVPEIPSKKEDIITKNEELASQLDITEILASVTDSKKALSDSIAQMKQVTNPSEEFVLERIQTVATVTEALAVTEDNDPNGNLHKAGGYTSAIYFTSDMVDAAAYGLEGDSIVKGTDGGGCIEVYETPEYAEKRSEYLSLLDGSAFASGSHTVVGTVLIRTSDNLTASQQTELETNIYNSLIELK